MPVQRLRRQPNASGMLAVHTDSVAVSVKGAASSACVWLADPAESSVVRQILAVDDFPEATASNCSLLESVLCLSQGRKSELEKFAGALFTTSVEGFVPETGRGVQVRHLEQPTSKKTLKLPHSCSGSALYRNLL